MIAMITIATLAHGLITTGLLSGLVLGFGACREWASAREKEGRL